MDELDTLSGLGFAMSTPAYLIGAIVFGLIGFAAYRHGKRMARAKIKWMGIALMFYPYAISGTAMLYVIGVALCLAIYFWRD